MGSVLSAFGADEMALRENTATQLLHGLGAEGLMAFASD